ncbi:MAG: VWA domain-containing protein [Acidobacteriota bacterium]|jgi:VWFA-related protein|nr:VWA domain-containing protein [Acidobacteriota bacterium]
MTRTGVLRTTLATILAFCACVACAPLWTPLLQRALPSSLPTTVEAQRPSSAGTPPDDPDAADPGAVRLPQASISVSVDMVSLQALVTDDKGNVITGLGPDNFTIYEDGVKQEIKQFAPVEANTTVVMLVEFSKRIELFLDDVYNAMYAFVQTLRPGDWTAVVGYDMHTTIFNDFTQDKQEVYKALRQFTYPAWDESNISDAVMDTIDRTQELDGKVAILLIGSGLDTFSRHTYDQALKACKDSNASIYAIGVGRWVRDYLDARGYISASTNIDFLMGENRLKSFADYTGGAAWFPRYATELPAIFSQISTQLRSQYSIGYVSSNTKRDGKYRKIKVEVQTDLKDKKGKPLKPKVVARKGYTAKSI